MRTLLGLSFLIPVFCFGQQDLPAPDREIKDPKTAIAVAKERSDSNEEFLYYSKLALKLSQQQKDQRSEATSTGLVGLAYYFNGVYDSTYFYYTQYLSIPTEYQDTLELEDAYFYLGTLEMMQDNWVGALPHLQKTLDIALAIKDSFNLGDVYNMIGSIYSRIAPTELSRALYHHRKALEIFELHQETRALRRTYGFIGSAHYDARQLDSALYFDYQALKMARSDGDSVHIGFMTHNIGQVYARMEQWDSTLANYYQSLPLLDRPNDHNDTRSQLLELRMGIAEALGELGEYDKAKAHLDTALAMRRAEDVLADFKRNRYHRVRSRLAANQGDYKLAYDDLLLAKTLDDSIYRLETSNQILHLMELYETETKDRLLTETERDKAKLQLAKQREKAKREEETREKNQVLRILGLVVAVSALVFLWLRQRRRAEKAKKELYAARLEIEQKEAERLRRELDFRNQSLTSYSILVAHKNEILQALKTLIEEGRSTEDLSVEMMKLLRSSTAFDNEWDEFKILFDEVHTGFREELRNAYPDLTANEERLCALLKLNLSSKQIANILNIAPKSVDVNRSRLRKKMGLEASDNLKEHIRQL